MDSTDTNAVWEHYLTKPYEEHYLTNVTTDIKVTSLSSPELKKRTRKVSFVAYRVENSFIQIWIAP